MASFSRTMALAALLPIALAFQDTIPVVAWASHPSEKLDALATHVAPLAGPSHLFDSLLEGNDLCRYDALVIVEQPGLHASDLRALSPSSYIASRLRGAASALEIPYLPYAEGDELDLFKRGVAERCAARRVELSLGQGGVDFREGEKHVVCVSMPDLDGDGSIGRNAAMRAQDVQLSNDIARVVSALPSHLVLYVGSSPFMKRQDDSESDAPAPTRPTVHSDSVFAPVNTTLVHGGLFQRYQFLTPGLLTALLVTFCLLVPFIMIGIYALASIQSPLYMNAPKGPSLEKKMQ